MATWKREKYNGGPSPTLLVDYSFLLILLQQPCKIKAGLWESDYVYAPLISSTWTENSFKISQKRHMDVVMYSCIQMFLKIH